MPEPVTLVGVSVHVRPADGLMLEDRVVTPLKPWRAVIVTVEVPAVPAFRVTVVGPVALVKS